MKLREEEKRNTSGMIKDCIYMAFVSHRSVTHGCNSCSWKRWTFCVLASYHYHQPRSYYAERAAHHPPEFYDIPHSSFSSLCPGQPVALPRLEFPLLILLQVASFLLTCSSCLAESCVITCKLPGSLCAELHCLWTQPVSCGCCGSHRKILFKLCPIL